MKIKSVSLEFPMSQHGELLSYMVGEKGITKIMKSWLDLGGDNGKPYYRIFKDDKVVADLYHYSLITYFEED